MFTFRLSQKAARTGTNKVPMTFPSRLAAALPNNKGRHVVNIADGHQRTALFPLHNAASQFSRFY
jgi:hypothetical protein